MTLALAALVLSATAVQEKVDNPQYAAWKSCKPGSWVKHKMVIEQQGMTMEMERLSTLVEVKDDEALLEVTSTMVMQGRTMALPAAKESVKAQVEKKDGQGELSETEEDVEAAGKTFKCKAWTWTQTQNGQEMKAKGWVSADVPGGMVKSEFSSPQMPKPMQMTMMGFEKK